MAFCYASNKTQNLSLGRPGPAHISFLAFLLFLRSSKAAVPNLFGIRDGFHGRQFFCELGWGWGGGFRMIQVHYIYCTLYYYYYISSTSDQALDPGVWGPQLYRGASLTLHYQLEGF